VRTRGRRCLIDLDTLFDNIDLYSNLQEIEDTIAADLHRHSIAQVMHNPWQDKAVTVDQADLMTTADVRKRLVADPRCPEWLRREIVWAELKRPN